jgi:arginyl-tRNA synthetase
VNFEGEKFSTRKGRIAAVEALLDEAEEKAREEIEKRKIADQTIAPAIGIGAIKFSLVKIAPNKPITFRWSEALNFEGESAPYIQYAHARSCRILEKSKVKVEGVKVGEVDCVLENDEEKLLVKTLSEFPETVENAVKNLRPDIIAQYMLKLTSAYGGFYMKCPVLDSEEKIMKRRLLLVDAVKKTIERGLGLIGIQAPERM